MIFINLEEGTDWRILEMNCYSSFSPILAFIFLLFLGSLSHLSLKGQKLTWEHNYGSTGHDWPGTVRPTSDGGYILAGRVDSAGQDVSGPLMGEADVWVAKLDSAGGIEWEQNYGGSDHDVPFDIREAKGQGYIVCAITYSSDGDISGNVMGIEEDIWLIRLDDSGQIIWENNFGGSECDQGHSVLETGDGNFVVTGVAESSDGDVSGNVSGSGDVWTLKVGPNGSLLWEENHSQSDYDAGFEIQKGHDNGYVVSGRASGPQGFDYQAYVLKLDSVGALEWDNVYGGSQYEALFSIKTLDDGGYITTGYSYSDDGDVSDNYGKSDIWVLGLDSTGNMEWERNYGGSNSESASSVHHDHNGGYIIGGKTRSDNGDVTPPQDSVDHWVLKLDSVGNILWEECYGGTLEDHGQDLRPCPDGGYIMSGQSMSDDQDVSGNHGITDIWILRLDSLCAPLSAEFEFQISDSLVLFQDSSTGNIQSWSWSFGDDSTSKEQEPLHIYEETGHYQVCLTVEDICGDSSNFCDTLTIDGINTGKEPINKAPLSSLHPTPFKDKLQLTLDRSFKKVDLVFYDLHGRRVWGRELNDGRYFTLHPPLPSGTYLLSIRTEEGNSLIRVIKQR